MALRAGARLGVYDVIAPIGEGGMGAVYRATDTTLNRLVAIKILPDAFAADPDRAARFEREAKTLASLNHPAIAAIYGFEKSAGILALVMELVEGETLDAQIKSARSVSVRDVLAQARQIADALDAAHGQGIIHRDLKPANIIVRADGAVKVLDFGLAKAIDPLHASAAAAALANSPTITSPAARTGAGVILGTAAYMSPEQARGKVVDKRSDLWAFGAVLFEMLTGTRAFPGDDVTDTIAAVIANEPDWTRLPAETPEPIRRLLRRCLVKDRTRRLSDAADARLEIDDALSAHTDRATPDGVANRASGRPWTWVAAGGAGIAFGAAIVLIGLSSKRPATPTMPQRFSVELGSDALLSNSGVGAAVTISPDGTVIAFVARTDTGGDGQLYVRRLNQLQGVALAGTDGADDPFFSTDGQSIAFFAAGKLKKIAVTGGAVVTLCEAANGRGGEWAEDGTIVFSPSYAQGVRLMRVSSAGGAPEPLTALADGEVTQRWPQMLPGGKTVLFTSSRTTGAFDAADIVVQTLPSGARAIVQRGGYHGRYLPSGHLVFVRDGTLFAVPFDLDRREVRGKAVPVIEHLSSNADTGGAQFALSTAGTLAYLPEQGSSGGAPISWMDRAGKTTVLRATPANWTALAFAPDGRRLAMEILDGQTDVWVYEWVRDTLTRLTVDPGLDIIPVWTPDSRRIAFASQRADKSTPNLYWVRTDGTGDTQRLTESRNEQLPSSWHPGGRFLAFVETHPQTGADLMILPLEGDEASGWRPGKPTAFLNTIASEDQPMFSPDGRWLAYQSDESGRVEVYVRPFPGPGGKAQISTGGGSHPVWSRTKRELLYGLNGQIMVASYSVAGDAISAEKPRLWSEGRYVSGRRMFDLHPDGERVAIAAQTPASANQDHVTFIFHFFDELRGIAPTPAR